MRLLWEDRAWEDYCYWQEHDQKILKRINTLLKDIQRNGYEVIGKPKPYTTIYTAAKAKKEDQPQRADPLKMSFFLDFAGVLLSRSTS